MSSATTGHFDTKLHQYVSKTVVIMLLFSPAFEKTNTEIFAANAVTLVEFYIPLVTAEFHVCSGWHFREKKKAHREKCALGWLLISVPSSASDKTLMVVQPVELRS